MNRKLTVPVRGCRLFRAVVVLLASFSLAPVASHASGTLPAEFARLVPGQARLLSESWGMYETEFGYSYGGNMHAAFPGSVSCDMTIGPELRIELKGDTWSDEPPMLDLALQVYDQAIERAREGLPQTIATFRNNSYVQAVGAVQEEQSPVGHIVAMEYRENCKKHPDGAQTLVRAFARRGGAMLDIDLWIDAELPAATAMAKEMLERFQQVDIAAVVNTAVANGEFTPEPSY